MPVRLQCVSGAGRASFLIFTIGINGGNPVPPQPTDPHPQQRGQDRVEQSGQDAGRQPQPGVGQGGRQLAVKEQARDRQTDLDQDQLQQAGDQAEED